MGDRPQEYRTLTREELNEIAGEELPERAAMSLINANVAAPINLAAALNATTRSRTRTRSRRATSRSPRRTDSMTMRREGRRQVAPLV